MSALNLVLESIYWILPAYIANAVPVILGGGVPLDFGKNFLDGKRIFGDGKTIKGFGVGVIIGTLVGVLQGRAELGFLISVGALCGDLAGSFLKRRMNMESGEGLPVVDQLGFVVFAILFGSLIEIPTLDKIAVILTISFILHYGANYIAHKLKLKKVPW